MASTISQLPDEPLFHHLIQSLTANPRHVVVQDHKNGTKANCSQLLTDILHMRETILRTLPQSTLDSCGKIEPDNPFVIILAPGNYDYIVAALAILACGGALAPIASSLTPEEGCYIVETTKASCMLVSSQYQHEASQIEHYHAAHSKKPSNFFTTIQIAVHNVPPTESPQVQINSAMKLDPKSPGLLLFTSGTTGPPKGVVRPRNVWYTNPPRFPSDQVTMCFRSPNWVGVGMRLLWAVLAGTRVEIISDDPREMWELFAKGYVTQFSAPPVIFAALMRYFKEYIDPLPAQQRSRYMEGVSVLQRVVVSGGVTWPNVMKFWKDMLGRPLTNMYSSTEVTAALETTDDTDPNLERCIGKPRPGVQIKLSEGDRGEILLKSPTMITRYLGDEAATRAAIDGEGYYKSGDLGHRIGDQYVIDGRFSTDFIRYHGLRVPIHEVEARLVQLPYVSEAYVVAATYGYKRQVAALIRASSPNAAISLLQIRLDLQDRLQAYKLPTLMRILQDNEQVVETKSGKPRRDTIAKQYFPISDDEPLPAGFEVCDPSLKFAGSTRKAWDWGGMS